MNRFKQPLKKPHLIESIELIPSGGGVFDVELDGRLVFSKHQVGRHANIEEIMKLVAAKLGEPT